MGIGLRRKGTLPDSRERGFPLVIMASFTFQEDSTVSNYASDPLVRDSFLYSSPEFVPSSSFS